LNNSFIKISGVNICLSDYSALTEEVRKSVNEMKKQTITYANFYVCNFCRRNDDLRKDVNNFGIVHPDGLLVYFAAKFLYRRNKNLKRINGTDFYSNLFDDGKNYRIFFVGGLFDLKESDIIERFAGKMTITGQIRAIKNISNYSDLINATDSDILLVGLGTPYQEKWINENKNNLNVPVIIAVGSGLDFLAGKKKRAPVLLRKIGMEWLFRLFQEPQRLWKRYILGIPVFLFYVIVQKVKFILKK
jgi:N-acetylglucosaminyldiphosphoundecaprenol N-acetyl-beta-D-mannosaminyltransferase